MLEVIASNVAKLVVKELQSLSAPWAKMPEHEQREKLARIKLDSTTLARRAAHEVLRGDHKAVRVLVDQVAFKPDGIKCALSVRADDLERHALADNVGAEVIVALVPIEEYELQLQAQRDQLDLFEERDEERDDARDELLCALEKSVAMQSHYAQLLNDYDGGERIVFESAQEWIERLRATGSGEMVVVAAPAAETREPDGAIPFPSWAWCPKCGVLGDNLGDGVQMICTAEGCNTTWTPPAEEFGEAGITTELAAAGEIAATVLADEQFVAEAFAQETAPTASVVVDDPAPDDYSLYAELVRAIHAAANLEELEYRAKLIEKVMGVDRQQDLTDRYARRKAELAPGAPAREKRSRRP